MKTNSNPKAPGLDCGFGSENKALDYAFQVVDEAAPPKKREGRDLVVCSAAEIPEGGRRTVVDGKRSIGVFRIGGQFYALLNVCPHMGAPLCAGKLHGTHRPSEVHEYDPTFHGRILRCPWHGWEFDVMTGKGLYDRYGRAATFPVRVDSRGNVVLTV
jgi:nitrite reductase/ring-hydroxylating ferredoxin subunit